MLCVCVCVCVGVFEAYACAGEAYRDMRAQGRRMEAYAIAHMCACAYAASLTCVHAHIPPLGFTITLNTEMRRYS